MNDEKKNMCDEDDSDEILEYTESRQFIQRF